MASATAATITSRPAAESANGAFSTTRETAGELAREAALHPVRIVSPWYGRIAVGIGVVRVGFGFTALALPEVAGSMWIGGGASGRDKAVLVRALGGRDIALGAGMLLSARHGGVLRRWFLLGALSDLVDTLATAAGFTELPRWRRWLVLFASGSAAATAVVVAPNLSPPRS